MEPTAWLGLATLVLGVPLCAIAAFLLWKKSREAPHLRVLRERFIVALITLALALVFGLIFVNNDQVTPPISDVLTKYITRAMILVMAVVPAVGWILLYRSLSQSKDPRP